MNKFDTKPSQAAFSAVFSNFEKFRPEVAGDVISDASLVYVGVGVLAKFGKLFHSFADQTRFTQFCAVLNYILQPTVESYVVVNL